MQELYLLTILYAAISGASSGVTTLSPNAYTKTGPMDQASCLAAANALNNTSSMFHATCEHYPSMTIYSLPR